MRKAAPSPGRPEEMTNAQTEAENAGRIIRRRGGSWVAAGGKRRAGGGKMKLITIEAGICMKTNKTTTICPGKKRHFCITKRHFMQRHTYFAKIGGFFVTFRALRNAFLASKCTNSSPRVSPVANDIRPLRGRRAASTLTGPCWVDAWPNGCCCGRHQPSDRAGRTGLSQKFSRSVNRAKDLT